MTVDECYVLMKAIVSKNVQQGYLSPSEFNRYINQAQVSYLDYLKGEYQKYQAGRPISVVEFSQNQMVRQSFAPLIYNTILTINSTTGISPFPYAFEFTDAMWGTSGYYNIRFTQQDRLASTLNSRIDPIASNPVYLLRWEGFQFFPTTLGSTRLSYIRTPPSITWASIPDANGVPQYDPANSSQPVWGNTDMLQIITRALSMVGVSLQLGAVIQYANDIKNNGQ